MQMARAIANRATAALRARTRAQTSALSRETASRAPACAFQASSVPTAPPRLAATAMAPARTQVSVYAILAGGTRTVACSCSAQGSRTSLARGTATAISECALAQAAGEASIATRRQAAAPTIAVSSASVTQPRSHASVKRATRARAVTRRWRCVLIPAAAKAFV